MLGALETSVSPFSKSFKSAFANPYRLLQQLFPWKHLQIDYIICLLTSPHWLAEFARWNRCYGHHSPFQHIQQ